MHFEFNEYYFVYFTFNSNPDLLLLFDPMLFPFRVNVPLLSLKEFRSPPVKPTGEMKIETSMHEGVKAVDPVQRHLPSTQTPFLLQ